MWTNSQPVSPAVRCTCRPRAFRAAQTSGRSPSRPYPCGPSLASRTLPSSGPRRLPQSVVASSCQENSPTPGGAVVTRRVRLRFQDRDHAALRVGDNRKPADLRNLHLLHDAAAQLNDPGDRRRSPTASTHKAANKAERRLRPLRRAAPLPRPPGVLPFIHIV